MDTGVLDFFNKKLILDYYFCLKSEMCSIRTDLLKQENEKIDSL